jgi:hypothetical protein
VKLGVWELHKAAVPLLGLLLTCAALCLSAGIASPVAAQDFPLIGPVRVEVSDIAAVPSSTTPGRPTQRSAAQGPDLKSPRRAIAVSRRADAAAPPGQASSVQPAAVPTAPNVFFNSFDGLDNNDNASITGFTVTPPDPQLAVGPGHVVEMVNIIGSIYTKKGATVSSFALVDFFNVPSGWNDTDPKIVYDALSGRWFATYVSYQDNPGVATDFGRLHIAVSVTDDPTGAWNVYYIQYNDVLPDYAAIGLSDDKVTVSSNVFDIDNRHLVSPCAPTQGYCGEQTVVIQKSELLAGAASPATTVLPLDPTSFTVRPAHSLSSTSDQYLATFDLSAGLPSTHLVLTRIAGTPALANVTRTVVASPVIQSQDSPPLSQTAGGGTIDSGDFRMLEVVYRDGTLWTAAGASCVPAGDSASRSCLHLVQMDATTGAVLQEIMYAAAGEYYSWPAIRTDNSGNLFVVMTHTNSSTFAEAGAASRMTGDTPNTLGPMAVLQAGSVIHTSGRWGDYLGAAVDPVYPACIWLNGEYAKSTSGADWGTYIGSVGYAGCDGDSDGWASPADNCPAISNVSQTDSDSDGVGEPCDNCPGAPNADQANQDGDPFGDACETIDCIAVATAWITPAGDSDCDGFPDTAAVIGRAPESFIGTDAGVRCAATPTRNDEAGTDAWPMDMNDDQRVTILDVSQLSSVFGSSSPGPPYTQRLDFNGDGHITIIDVSFFSSFYTGSCSP